MDAQTYLNTIDCPKCDGCGKLDSKEGKPWKAITRTANEEVRKGTVTPINCPDCKSTGRVPKPPEPKSELTSEQPAEPLPAKSKTKK